MATGSSKRKHRAAHVPGGLGGRTGRGGHRKGLRRIEAEVPLKMPKDVMKHGADRIARAVMDAAERARPRGGPTTYRVAMTWLTEQARRTSKTATPEQRVQLARAKDIVRSRSGIPQNRKGEGGVKGGPKGKQPRHRRRASAASRG